MSKHVGRKSQWTEITPIRHDGLYGYVEQNQHGRWDAFLIYQKRPSLESIALMRGTTSVWPPTPWPNRSFKKTTRHCGEHKRAREAMMAVEQAAKEMKTKNDPDTLV